MVPDQGEELGRTGCNGGGSCLGVVKNGLTDVVRGLTKDTMVERGDVG